MSESYFRGIPWGRFMEFISDGADRFSMLTELLKEADLGFRVLDIEGSRHIVIMPPERGRQRQCILVAHYDRAAKSPGANDNSAGVFLLFETALRLKQAKAADWIIIFTDKEELKQGESIRAQGAYGLALGLKNIKLDNSRIFSFDVCGAGDTMLISSTVEQLLKREGGGEKLQRLMAELRNFALGTARNLGMAKVLLAPTPFSDDAGFFRAGLAAQTITMLPSRECIALVAELRKNPGLADALISADPKPNRRLANIPETWRSINGPGDSHLRLTPEHFRTVVRFAEALCKS